MQSNKMIKKAALTVAVSTGLILTILNTPVQAQSLEDAVRAAQNYVPALTSQQHAVAAADARVGVAKSALRPQVRFTANTTVGEFSNNATRVGGITGSESNTSERADLVVTQRLFDFNQSGSQIANAKHLSKAERSSLELVQQNLTLQVVSAYIDVLRFQELDQIATQNVQAGNDIASIIDKQVTLGRSADVEKNLAQSQLAVTKSQSRRQAGLLAQARVQFYQLTGLQANNLVDLPLLKSVNELYTQRNPERINQLLEELPSIKTANSQLAAANSQRKSASASRYPTLDLELFAGQGSDENAVLGENDSYGASLNLRWDLYAGGGNKARLRAASSEQAAAQSNVDEEYRLARQQVLTAVEALHATEAELEYLAIEEQANKNVFNTYQQQLTAGRRSPIDVFVVLNNYNQSRLQLTDALYRQKLEQYSVVSAYGKLTKQLGL